MTDVPSKQHGLRFSAEVRFGDLITAAMVAAGIFAWGMRLEGRVDVQATQIAGLERRVEEYRADFVKVISEVRADQKDAIKGLGRKIDQLADAVSALAQSLPRPPQPEQPNQARPLRMYQHE